MGKPLIQEAASRFEVRFRSQGATDSEAHLRKLWGFDRDGEMAFGPGLSLDQRGFEFSGLAVVSTDIGTSLHCRKDTIADDPGSQWFFVSNASTDSHSRYGALWVSPGEACALRLKDFSRSETTANSQTQALAISDADLLAAQRALYGSPASSEIEFGRKMPAGSAPVASLLRIIDHLASTPKFPHQHAAQLERALKESALFELLLAWPGTNPAPQAQKPVLPASTRLARDFIHAHIADLPTISDVAAHCRVGVRALDRGFRKHLGASPWQYMLELRLQAVRDDLLASRHGGTVTEVAMHWGFSNLGTFAARYREQFGELPSETQRRVRVRGQPRRSAESQGAAFAESC